MFRVDDLSWGVAEAQKNTANGVLKTVTVNILSNVTYHPWLY